jgi:hypothetical protein
MPASVESAGRKTQRAAILRLLIAACGEEVALPEILALGIAQYSARICELRRLGFRIENRTERRAGSRHSWFRLVTSPVDVSKDKPQNSQTFAERRRKEFEAEAPLLASAGMRH